MKADPQAKRRCLRSRIVWRDKNAAPTTPIVKAKARITVQGFNDPDLFTLDRDAPTVQPIVVTIMMQVIASLSWLLFGGDIKSAFLQGGQAQNRPDRIYMYQPLDGFLNKLPGVDPTVLLGVIGSVPGLVKCPHLFYKRFRQVVLALGWHQHSLDACCFLYIDAKQIIATICVHVDDVVGGAARTLAGRRVGFVLTSDARGFCRITEQGAARVGNRGWS